MKKIPEYITGVTLDEIKKFYADMFVVDAFLGNTDRHNGNWGFLVKFGDVKISPVYDCGSSLSPLLDDSEMNAQTARSDAMNGISAVTEIVTDENGDAVPLTDIAGESETTEEPEGTTAEAEETEAPTATTPAATTTPGTTTTQSTGGYTYTALNQTMYAKSSVNVRSTPNSSGTKLGSLTAGQSVTVTGQCNETNWYRISYNVMEARDM